ncbi:4635_t:CDS:2 [Entrophospora sp. SA101]|nr:4635_t:CDS:2 [Entrophospora sp. SA101]
MIAFKRHKTKNSTAISIFNEHFPNCIGAFAFDDSSNCDIYSAYVASHKFIDKLKNLALSSSTDDEVHKRLMILFAQWSNNYKKKPGMENITSLYSTVSNKNSSSNGGGHTSSRKKKRKSTSSTLLNSTMKNLNNKKKQHERQSSKIGSAIQNATNLVNAITLLNPDMDFENDDELQECVAKCKASSEQLFKIIPTISGGTQLGPLLQCNDQIQGALELYSKYCEDCKKSDLDDVTSNFEKTKLQNNTREKKSFDYTKSNKEFDDLIDFDSYVSSTVYSKNLTDDPFEDPFADPISPSRTPDPDAEKKIKTHPKWTEV